MLKVWNFNYCAVVNVLLGNLYCFKQVIWLPNWVANTKIGAHLTRHRVITSNAEHSGDLGVATKEPRKGRPAATGRVLMRIVKCRLPGNLLWHPNLNAYSGYLAPAKPMAPGTRTPNSQNLPDVYAGLPHNLNTELPAKNR